MSATAADRAAAQGARQNSRRPTPRQRAARRRAIVTTALTASVLVGLATWLRASALAPDTLWLDDAWISLVGRAESVGDVVRMSATAPGFGLLLAALYATFGFGEVVGQAPAFVAAAVAPAALFAVARWRGLSWAAALLGAGVLLVAPQHVVYATRVKPFALDTLFAIALLAVAWWLVDHTARPRDDRRSDDHRGGDRATDGTRSVHDPRVAERRGWLTLVVVAAAGTVVSAAVATVAVPVFGALLVVLAVRAVAGTPDGGDATIDLESRSSHSTATGGPLAVIRGLRRRVGAAPDGPRWRSALAATVAFAVFAGAYYLGHLSRAITGGLAAYWEGFFLDVSSLAALRMSAATSLGGLLDGIAPLDATTTALVLGIAVLAAAVRHPSAAWLALAPLVGAVVLAVLQLAPLGGGRTDHHLYPSLALLVALGADALVRAARRLTAGATRPAAAQAPDTPRTASAEARDGATGAPRFAVTPAGATAAVLALAVVAAGVVRAAGDRPEYPASDVSGLVAEVDAALGDDEVLVLYPAVRWAYARYTQRPVSFTFGLPTANGFEVAVDDDQVVILRPQREPPFEHLTQLREVLGPAPDGRPTGADGQVTGQTRQDEPRTTGAWLLASTTRPDLAVAEEAFVELGFVEIDRVTTPGGLLLHYERPTS